MVSLRRVFSISCCGIVALAFLATSATAANIVTNGGFEGGTAGDTASIPSWAVTSPNPGLTGGHCVADANVRTGACSAFFIEFGGNGSISQTLVTTAGTNYILTFYLASTDPGQFPLANQLNVNWGGSTVFSQSNTPIQGFTLVTQSVTATSASTLLEFSGANTFAGLFIDDVSVDEASAIPEPTTWFSALAGLALVAARMRFRRA